ncbi:hypothetical protein E4631_16020 [Hymenobacter sp. UV11]|uniref:hypothetical protein n=1 Tax=Hymenobacter sp. UV11 TaxID=1849735 RepID=UPI00105FA300|nr:hypothetical protein [Hymenobacter sp. UV11]TDN37841.1 hypothetical protein A8B98_00860 [Hymenobacter sp. UV11]TFZ65051.1 hypothetical protein E4631_16020 [Hymenobacter sp. UV11]
MLDFFFISDEQSSNFALTQAEYAGGITMREFEQAQHAHIIEYDFDFFDDFRWSNVQVKQKLPQFQRANSEQFDVLKKLLQRVVELNCGVIAFGD